MTATLGELVYQPLDTEFAEISRSGKEIVLVLRPGSKRSAAELTGLLCHPALVRSSPAEDRIAVELASEEAAKTITLSFPMLTTGLYIQESFQTDELVLRRVAPGNGPLRIIARSMPTEEEEWRRFLAREVDVLPYASPSHLRYLREVPSVRVMPVAKRPRIDFFFRVRDSVLADLSLRQAIALALRRQPLAKMVVGDPSAAVVVQEDLALARQLLASRRIDPAQPLRLRILVHQGSSDLVRAALVIQQQLALVGLEVTIEALDTAPYIHRINEGRFELLLHYGAVGPRLAVFRSNDKRNLCGYANPAFDAALDAGDEDRAAAILAQDAAVAPLYHIEAAAALDRSLCADSPQSVSDLSWLATIHRCPFPQKPGEREVQQ
ncbi:MAG: ABC transporter substrate-binding protein [Pseudomonadota bacterium]